MHKIAYGEIGYFAEYQGRIVGSIWASINREQVPVVVRTVMELQPNEGLIHDIVTSDEFRGRGIGSFMTSIMARALIEDHRLSRVEVDVNVRNVASVRVMKKVGLRVDRKVLYVSALGRLLVRWILRKYG